MARIAVIIPSYNCAPFVEQAVESVFRQTYSDYELIVVDDGSSDNTAQVLAKYSSNPKCRYYRQQNRGLPGARNAGARITNSEYLAFLDADDQLEGDALRLMVQELDRTSASWCLIDIVRAKPSGREIECTELPKDDPFYAILRDNFIQRGMFFRRDAFVEVGMYDESIRYREDWDLHVRMFAARKSFTYLPKPLYIYTWREGSIVSANRVGVLDSTAMLLKKHHKSFADAGDKRAAKIYAQNMWDLGRFYFYDVRLYRRALACVLQSLKYDFSPARLFHPLLDFARQVTKAAAPSQ